METAEEVLSKESPQSHFHWRAWNRQWCSYERIPDRCVFVPLKCSNLCSFIKYSHHFLISVPLFISTDLLFPQKWWLGLRQNSLREGILGKIWSIPSQIFRMTISGMFISILYWKISSNAFFANLWIALFYFRTIGEIMAVSITQDGPPPNFFSGVDIQFSLFWGD